MAVAAGHGVGAAQGVDDRLLGAVHHGLKQPVDQAVMQHGHAGHRSVGLLRHGIGGRKGQRNIAAAMAEHRTGAGQAGAGAQREPAQLARIERCVGGDQQDDGALFGLGRVQA